VLPSRLRRRCQQPAVFRTCIKLSSCVQGGIQRERGVLSMQVGTAKATKVGDQLDTDFKLSYTKPVGKSIVTVDAQPALKKVRWIRKLSAMSRSSVCLPVIPTWLLVATRASRPGASSLYSQPAALAASSCSDMHLTI
jgi:hypothetical protein